MPCRLTLGMREESDTPDARVAKIAARQHGVVTAEQLREVGIDKSGVSRRVKSGRLHRLHRGVYAVGHSAPSHHRRWIAAVLACGEGAVLSHHSAAALWELLRPIRGPVHVSVPTSAGLRKRRGIHLHRCPSLSPVGPPFSPPSPAIRGGRGRGTPTDGSTSPSEPSPSPSHPLRRGGRRGRLATTRRHNIPVTTIQRTIHDLEGTIAPYLFRRAKRQAEHMGIRLEGVESKRLRSDLEEDFLALFLANHFPHPETNVKIGRHEVDFLWPPQRLVVEADFFAYHQGSVSFDDDHRRDLDLHSRGYTVHRFTDRQLEDEPDRIVAVVREALS